MRRALAFATLTLAAAAAAAGNADVRFAAPEAYTDAGFGSVETGRTTAALARDIERLARALPAGQTLKVEVTDVDLAGHVWPSSGRDVRVARGGADWPRIELSWQLMAGSQVLRSGQERLTDMNYLWHTASRDGSPEERLLRRWFADTFLTTTTAAR